MQWRKVTEQLRPTPPELAGVDGRGRDPPAGPKTLPRLHGAEPHSINPLERLDGGTEQRTDAIGISPEERAMVHPLGAILPEQQDAWPVQQAPSTTRETIAALRDDATMACRPRTAAGR